ncbi:MAG: glycosyltransferase family 2 protein [Nitrospirae bacterium]|nr:glycosyltransferase family 2 protein [Nitrospirota bacterium]
MQKDSISVVIPAYNEELRILPTLNRLYEYLRANFRDFEIIVVDDGSKDGTSGIVGNIALSNIRLIQHPVNRGKGSAVKHGILSSKGSLILISDADMSTPIEEIEKLIPFIESGFDIAIGSRGLKESEIALRQPWHRENMGKIFNIFVRGFLVRGIKDTQCGFKLFKAESAKRIFEKCTIAGFSFDVEALFLARRMGYKIKEVPIRWLDSPDSKVRIIQEPAKMLIDLLRIRLYWILGRYGL